MSEAVIESRLRNLEGAMSSEARFQSTHFCIATKNGELIIETKRDGIFHYWLIINDRPQLVSTSKNSVFAEKGSNGFGRRMRPFDPKSLKVSVAYQF